MKDCVIVSACRTAVGAFGGTLRDLNCTSLGSVVMEEAVKRAGIDAELIAQIYNLSREEIDAIALRSHNNAERATQDGDFREEIVPVEIPQRKGKPPVIFSKDEHFRPGLAAADLMALPAAFVPKTGKVTAGNSSGVNDGASAMIIMSAEKVKELGLKPLARIRAIGRGGCHPSVMGLSPVPSVRNLSRGPVSSSPALN